MFGILDRPNEIRTHNSFSYFVSVRLCYTDIGLKYRLVGRMTTGRTGALRNSTGGHKAHLNPLQALRKNVLLYEISWSQIRL